jgi:hypothetical protein
MTMMMVVMVIWAEGRRVIEVTMMERMTWWRVCKVWDWGGRDGCEAGGWV